MKIKPQIMWTQEMKEAIVRMKNEGFSYPQIATEMEKMFGKKFTVGMIGNAFLRLRQAAKRGISTTASAPSKPHRPANSLGRSLVTTSGPNARLVAAKKRLAHMPAPVAIAEQYLDPFEPDNSGLPGKRFIDLHGGQCKWEVSGKNNVREFRFCAEPVADGYPYNYCTLHMLRSKGNPLK